MESAPTSNTVPAPNGEFERDDPQKYRESMRQQMMAMGNFRAAESSDKVDDAQSTSTAKLAPEAADV